MTLIHDYPRMFRNIDIGIAPLSDVPFHHAKSAIKGLEYPAAGVPFIASPSPEAKALPGYSNNFVYSIYTLVENALVEINVFQGEPLTSEQRSNALKAADGLAKRYAAAL